MIDNKILKLAMERRVKNQAKEEELKDLKELQTQLQEPKSRESQNQEPQDELEKPPSPRMELKLHKQPSEVSLNSQLEQILSPSKASSRAPSYATSLAPS